MLCALGAQRRVPPIEVDDIIDFDVVPKWQDPSFLRQKYVEENLSIDEIAALTFSASSTVHKHLKRFGIALRGSGENIRPQRRLCYGQKIVGRRVEEHKAERTTIAKMQDLRQRGFSYWKIAEILNAMRVPTKTRRGRWHARSVQKVLDVNEPTENTKALT